MSKPEKVTIDNKFVFKKIEKFFNKFQTDDSLEIDSIVILNGKDDEKSIKIKSSAMHYWLFKVELIDTLLVFTKKTLIIFTSQKKIGLLNELVKLSQSQNKFKIVFIEKNLNDNSEQFDEMFKLIETDASNSKEIRLGLFLKEIQYGPFIEEFQSKLHNFKHIAKESGSFVQELYCIKNTEEIEFVKLSGKATSYFQKQLIQEIEDQIDQETQITHKKISEKIEELLFNNDSKVEKTLKIDKNYLDFSYTPIIQSGGTYDLRIQAESNNDLLSYDTILLCLGMKFTNFNTNIMRTLFINPTEEQKNMYSIISKVYEESIQYFVPGKSIKSIYKKISENILKEKPELIDFIPTSFGFGIGLEFKETNLIINAKNDKIIDNGMTFVLNFSFNNLKSKINFAIQIGDTILIENNGAVNLTSGIPIKLESISYILENEKVNSKIKERPILKEKESIMTSTTTKRTKRTETISNIKTENQQLDDHQKLLIERKIAELKERYSDNNYTIEEKKIESLVLSTLKSYNNIKEIPSTKPNEIFLDQKNFTILIPFPNEKTHIPFHIATIKSVSKNQDGNFLCLRINFHNPGDKFSKDIIFPKLDGISENPGYILKEISLKCNDFQKFTSIFKQIRDLQKSYKVRKIEKNSEKLEILTLNKGNNKIILKDVQFRPTITGRKTVGYLEAHINGFKFNSTKNEYIELLYSNIKFALFQPCDKPSDDESIIALHFNLKDPIRISNKFVSDLQVFVEAAGMVENIGKNRNRESDDEDSDEENIAKARRKRINREFEDFVKKVQDLTKENLIFDIPFRELAFYGIHDRSLVLMQPTVNCLINIVEKPFFVLDLNEIDFVCFERIAFNVKNFDMTLIKKDLSQNFIRISSIPIIYLDQLKKWIDKLDIIFSDSKINLNWSALIKDIKEDPQLFIEEGGWTALAQDPSDEENEEDDEEDSVFSENDIEDDEDDEDEEFSEYSEATSESFAESEPDEDEILGEESEFSEEESIESLPKRKGRIPAKNQKTGKK